jgi:hypothetical protein
MAASNRLSDSNWRTMSPRLDGVAVGGAEDEGLQGEQVQSSLEEFTFEGCAAQ